MTGSPDIRYASAGGVVARGGRVLVLRRPGRLRPDGQAEVRLPKGHVEPGESCEETARREVAEEAGLEAVDIVADLGQQLVEFDWRGRHYARDEHYYLMIPAAGAEPAAPEQQFTPEWLPWERALAELTFEAEREWLRRARAAAAEPGLPSRD